MTDVSEPVEGDAFGAILARCWSAGARDGVAFEIIERDDGFIGVTDAARYFDGPQRWSELEREALDQVRGRILDVGCGAGRHAVPLHNAGHDVIGLDPSPAAVAIVAERRVSAVRGTAEHVPDEVGTVDTVLLLGNNLGLLGGRDQAARVLDELARVAAPGGCLLGTGMDPYQTDQRVHLDYHRRNRDRGRLPGQVRMRVRHETLASGWFDYLFVSIDEFADLITGTPWTLAWVQAAGAAYAVRLELPA